MERTSHPNDNAFHNKLLKENLKKIFGEFDEKILNEIEHQLIWIEIQGGDLLMQEGDDGDGLYFVLSGRLFASKLLEDGSQKKIGEIVRGETVGEMAIFTDEPRYATITAIRDSVLVKLEKSLFEKVISEYPSVALNVTRLIINRFKNIQSQKISSHPINICFVPLHTGMNINKIVKSIYDIVKKNSVIFYVDSKIAKDSVIGSISDQADGSINVENEKLIEWLNNLEAANDFMFYVCDESPTEWNKKALRQADHIVLLGDSAHSPELTVADGEVDQQSNALISLVLVHPEDTLIPINTPLWLKVRPNVNQNFHLRHHNNKDLKRLARILSGKATGIVFAGGGAKGFAHLGVLKALDEYGIHFDYVGGTSIGGMIAGSAAVDAPIDRVLEIIKEGSELNPSGDLNYIPILSLVKGVNIKNMVNTTMEKFCGKADVDLTDMWIPTFVVATNYSSAAETVFVKGPMCKILLASAAIPGIFPPIIIDGDIYVDGGTFNNFPADVMSTFGVSKIIGIDFVIDKTYKLTIDEMPTNNTLLKEKLFRRNNLKNKVPSMASIIINSTLLYSTARRHESKNLLDLHFNPDVSKFGLTAWTDFDIIVKKGYYHAIEVLGKMSLEEINKFREEA